MPRNEGTVMIEHKTTKQQIAEAIVGTIWSLMEGCFDLIRHGVFFILKPAIKLVFGIQLIYQGE